MILNDVNYPIDSQARQHYAEYPEFYKLLNESLMNLRLYLNTYTYTPVYVEKLAEYIDKSCEPHKLITDRLYDNIVGYVIGISMQQREYHVPINMTDDIPESIVFECHGPVYFNQLEQVLSQNDGIAQQTINTLVDKNPKLVTALKFVSILQWKPRLISEYERKKDVYYFGHKSYAEWYGIYTQSYTDRYNPQKLVKQRSQQARAVFKDEHRVVNQTIAYPFKSKVDRYIADNKLDESFKNIESLTNPSIPNRNKLRKTLMRPYYSPKPGCWEIDHVFNLCKQGDSWMFCININTRYLVVYEIPERAADVLSCLKRIHKDFTITSIRGDGSRSYTAMNLLNFYKTQGIKPYFPNSKFTYHNKIIDSVVRTIRDAIGYQLLSNIQLHELVDYYNNTYHRIIMMTPGEMQGDVNKEWAYIRYCDEKLVDVKRNQLLYGLHEYEPGNVLLVRVDLSKTAGKHEKNRKYFNRLGLFIKYIDGNVTVKLFNPVLMTTQPQKYTDTITVPIFYTKKVSDTVKNIPPIIKNKYFIEP